MIVRRGRSTSARSLGATRLFAWPIPSTALLVDDATVALSADNVALTQANTLVVQDATVGLSTDAIALTQANTLVVDDALVALGAESPALTQANTLVVQDALVALATDAIALTQANTLAVDDATVALGAENVTLEGIPVEPVIVPSPGAGGGAGRDSFRVQPWWREQPGRTTARGQVRLSLTVRARAVTTPEVQGTGVVAPKPRPQRPAAEAVEFRSFAKARARLRVITYAAAEVTTTARGSALLNLDAFASAETGWDDDAEIMAAVMLLDD